MASYHLSIKSGKKGKAANHAAYIAREGKHGKNDETQDLVFRAHGNLPDWAEDDPMSFWKMADQHERANGAAYREFEVALPAELTIEQQKELLMGFINKNIGQKPYQTAIHAPTAALGGVAQPHAHLMFSDRAPDGIDRPAEQHFKRHNPVNPELGGAKKDSGGKPRAELRDEVCSVRESWAQLQNASLEMHGHAARVDHRSHKDRGIDAKPERHLGQSGVKKMSDEERKNFRGAKLAEHEQVM